MTNYGRFSRICGHMRGGFDEGSGTEARHTLSHHNERELSVASRTVTPFRIRHVARPLSVIAIVLGTALAFATPVFAAVVHGPKISASQATFAIPVGSTSTWTLRLWTHGALQGSESGTAGTLTIAVPATAGCTFQADVSVVPLGGHSTFYSGNRTTVPGCGPLPTIAGDIYLCTVSGGTTTEVASGTLAVAGPEALPTQPNPLAPTAVPDGTYTMTAASPSGYVLVGCGGSATVSTTGATATEVVVAELGDTGLGTNTTRTVNGAVGVGIFYVTPATTGAGGGAGSAGGLILPGISAQTNAKTTIGANPIVAASSASSQKAVPAATAASGSALAFTGMNTEPLLLIGFLALASGGFCMAASRLRRRPAITPSSYSRHRS
jgi:hypothetical protein